MTFARSSSEYFSGIPLFSEGKEQPDGPFPLKCLFVTQTGKKRRQLPRFSPALRTATQQRRARSVISNSSICGRHTITFVLRVA